MIKDIKELIEIEKQSNPTENNSLKDEDYYSYKIIDIKGGQIVIYKGEIYTI